MPRRTKQSTSHAQIAKKITKNVPYSPLFNSLQSSLKRLNKRRKDFLNRRPHRSFKKTARRDYKRSFTLPGYWSFTNQVRVLLVGHKGLFFKFALLHSIMSWLIFGVMSQENYQLLSQTVGSLGEGLLEGRLDSFSLNFAIFAGVLGGVFGAQLSEAQQVYGGLLLLLGWLTLVWLLRQIMASHKNIRLRDGLYFSGSPLIPTFLIFMVVLVQLLPFIIAIAAYIAASSVNVLVIPIFSILFWLIELFLVILSLYWLSASLIALVVVTLPGMYPLKALKVAGDLVTGRRLRILYRFAWLIVSLFFVWLCVLLPVIFVSNIEALSGLPIVPLTVLLLGSFSIVWFSAYMYVLYRKLIDDAASPA